MTPPSPVTVKIAASYLKEFKWLIVLCGILVCVSSAFEGLSLTLIIPLLEEMVSGATDSVVSKQTREVFQYFGLRQTFLSLVLLFSGLILLKFCFSAAADYAARVLSASLKCQLRIKAFQNLMALPLQFYYRRRTGDIISSTYMSSDEAGALIENCIRLINMIVLALAYITLQLFISVWLTMLALLCTLISYYFVVPRFRIGFERGEQAKEIIDKSVSFLQDRLSGIKTIKAFGNEQIHCVEFTGLAKALRNIAIKIQQNKIIANLFVEPLTVIVVILMLIIAVEGLQLDVVQLLAFFFAYSLLMPRIKAINTEYLVITEKLPHFEKIHELISSHEKTYLPSGEKGVNTIETDITFIDVWFRYPQTEDFVLKEINFSINWLKTTALVGASGGGKKNARSCTTSNCNPSLRR